MLEVKGAPAAEDPGRAGDAVGGAAAEGGGDALGPAAAPNEGANAGGGASPAVPCASVAGVVNPNEVPGCGPNALHWDEYRTEETGRHRGTRAPCSGYR